MSLPDPPQEQVCASPPDEHLILLIQRGACPRSRLLLLLRHHRWMQQRIQRWARRTPLGAADVEDAQQQAYFAFRQAVARSQHRRGACCFRTFLGKVLLDRLRNFLRGWWRAERHFHRALPVEELLDMPADAGPGPAPVLSRSAWSVDDPVRLAQAQEAQAALTRAIARLPRRQRQLCEVFLAGQGLPQIARERGLSYAALRRRWCRVVRSLRTALGVDAGGPAP
jgi:RNA polymerase sigma factor (sigma-70 family)